MTDHPIFDALIAEHPDARTAFVRPRWSYAAALKAADEAIHDRTNARIKKELADAKRPAKKAAARKGAS